MVTGMPTGVDFLGCFAAPLRHVARALCGADRSSVSAETARRGIALIEECYRNRGLLDMPWHDEAELRRARELAGA